MQQVSADDDNLMKWASIPLSIQKLFKKHGNLNEKLFSVPYEASQKFDGTNVGKDQDGLMYGRNKMIPFTTNSYQKTKLDDIKKIEVKPIVDHINDMAGVQLTNFVLYGELMCNGSLYNYKEFGTFHVFGAMIKVEGEDACVKLLQDAGFACNVRRGNDSEDEERADAKIMLMMNQTFKDVLDKFNLPTVPYLGKFENFYELVVQNYEWMVKGNGEGLVIVANIAISKWKIGAEANATNLDYLRNLIDAIEDDKDKVLFGENTEKASDLVQKLYEIQKSNLIMGSVPQPKGKQPKAAPKKSQKIELTEEQASAYAEAIKSAKSKFDHADTYFDKGMKGVEEFAKLIAAECLNDIKTDNVD